MPRQLQQAQQGIRTCSWQLVHEPDSHNHLSISFRGDKVISGDFWCRELWKKRLLNEHHHFPYPFIQVWERTKNSGSVVLGYHAPDPNLSHSCQIHILRYTKILQHRGLNRTGIGQFQWWGRVQFHSPTTRYLGRGIRLGGVVMLLLPQSLEFPAPWLPSLPEFTYQNPTQLDIYKQ